MAMREKSLPERYEDLKDQRRRAAAASDLEGELAAVAREHELYDVAYSERKAWLQSADLARRLDICALAHRVFGDRKKAEAWLSRPNKSLGGQVPSDLLKDELGAAVVRETLEQIDHGIFA
jgi:putative toxin-antitoxin system antitoxin component (TIGR02293 family)